MADRKRKTPRTNLDRVREIAETLGGDDTWWKPKSGNNRIRVLPADTEDGSFFYSSVLHYGFRVGDQRRAFPCMMALKQSSCPVCQVIAANEDDTSPDAVKAVERLQPKRQFLMNVIDRNDNSETVKIWSAPKGVMKKILKIFKDPDYGDITDPDEGHDLTLEKEGEGLNTEYDVRCSPKTSAIGNDDWMDELHDLEEMAYREIPKTRTYINYIRDNYADTLDLSVLAVKDKEKARKDEEEPAEDLRPRLRKSIRQAKEDKKRKAREVEETADDPDEVEDELPDD